MTQDPDALQRRAVDLVNNGELRAARELLTTAARLADDVDVRARIAGTLSAVLVRLGHPDDAERVCEEAMRLPGLSDRSIALLAGQFGSLAERVGRLDVAERWLTRGIDGLPHGSLERANLLVNRSLVNIHRRALDAAAEDASEATRIFTELGLDVDAAQARHNEGYILLLEGDLVAALHEMLTARAVLVGLSDVGVAIGDLDRAEVLREAGQTTEAERILASVAEVFGSNGMPQSRAEAELQLARSLLAHDARAAALAARRASSRFQRLGISAWRARSEGVRLRAVLQSGRVEYRGDTTGRRRMPPDSEIERVAGELERQGQRSEARALRLTRLLARARRGIVDRGPTRAAASDSLEVRILTHEVRAERAHAAGDAAATRRHASSGLELLGEWQRSFGSIDLQTSVSMHGSGLIYRGLSSAVESGSAASVFEWSERARHLLQQVIPLRPPPDEGLADDLAELRMLRVDDPSGDWLSTPRARELRERARQRQWSGTGSVGSAERVGLEELRAALPSSALLISYVYTGAEMVAVAVDGRTRIVPLPSAAGIRTHLSGLRADLDMAATVRTGPVAAVVRRSLEERLEQLSRSLLEPVLGDSDASHVVVTAPGVLNGLPWAMLPAMRGRAFTLAGSATRWVAGRAAPRRAPTRAGFVVGPRVPRGEEEVTVAGAAWQAPSALVGAEATAAAATGLASSVDVFHVAAHGRHAIDNPMFSGLELADGTLFGYDIDLVPSLPDTVVLSACEVGRSSVRWGEEAVGMTRVWLHAGTECVIAAPVVVADDVACELLGAMHEGLARGSSPAEALAEASARTGLVAPFQAHGNGF